MGTDWFFAAHVDPVSLGGKGLALLLAVTCGGLAIMREGLTISGLTTAASIWVLWSC